MQEQEMACCRYTTLYNTVGHTHFILVTPSRYTYLGSHICNERRTRECISVDTSSIRDECKHQPSLSADCETHGSRECDNWYECVIVVYSSEMCLYSAGEILEVIHKLSELNYVEPFDVSSHFVYTHALTLSQLILTLTLPS